MGYKLICVSFICVMAAALLASGVDAGPFGSSRCPPPSKVYYTKPICRDDYDCNKLGKICCPNQAHTKSCTYPAPYTTVGNNNNADNTTSTATNDPGPQSDKLNETAEPNQSPGPSLEKHRETTAAEKFINPLARQRLGQRPTPINKRVVPIRPIWHQNHSSDSHLVPFGPKAQREYKPKDDTEPIQSPGSGSYKHDESTESKHYQRPSSDKHSESKESKHHRRPSSDKHSESTDSKHHRQRPLSHKRLTPTNKRVVPIRRKWHQNQHPVSTTDRRAASIIGLGEYLGPFSDRRVIPSGPRIWPEPSFYTFGEPRQNYRSFSNDDVTRIGSREYSQPRFRISQAKRTQPTELRHSGISSLGMRPRGILRWG